MQRRGPEPRQRRAMHCRAVAGVALEAIAREAQRQPGDQGITLLLGQHTGGGDGGAVAVAGHQGGLGARPATQRQHPIHDQQPRRAPQAGLHTLEGTEHGALGGGADPLLIDLGSGSLAEGPSQRVMANQGNQRSPAAGRQLLAVGEAGGGQGSQGRRRQHHRCREHGPEQTAAAHLINTDAELGWQPTPGI